MLTSTRRRSPLGAVSLVAAIGAAAAGAWKLGDPVPRLLVLGSGGNPLAAPLAATHADAPFAESPLARSLTLEGAHAAVDREPLLALADDVAREVGFWMLATSGAADLDAAERWLWAHDRVEDLAVRWAWAMRERGIYIRAGEGRLAAAVAPEPPRYAERDEVILLLAHAAWALDLRADWVRSPVHDYLVLRAADGARALGIEATAFRHVTERGARVVADEPAVGLLLTFSPEVYAQGVGGIRNPDPPWPGVYTPVTADELDGELLARLAARYDLAPAALQEAFARSPSAPLAQELFRRALHAGIVAWEAGDLAQVRVHAETLRALRDGHDAWLRPLREEGVLTAVLAWEDGRAPEAEQILAELFAAWEPEGAVMLPRGEAHAAAMWLDLEHGKPRVADWNRRLVPLMNRHQKDPAAVARLCGYGRKMRSAPGELETVLPICAEGGPK